MNKKILISAAALFLSLGLTACSTHNGMMKDEMGKEDMMKEDTMMKDEMGKEDMMKEDTMMKDEKGM